MKTIKRLIKVGIIYGVLIFLFTSCQTRENAPESFETAQTSNYTIGRERPLTSEISGQIEDDSEPVQSAEEKSHALKKTRSAEE